MIKSNRAAALRWLSANVGTVLDTVQTKADGTVTWIPGPRLLGQRSASGFTMASAGRESWISTDRANRFYVRGDTLTIESMVSMTSGPDGVAEVWHTTHYSVRVDAPFAVTS